MDRIDDPNVPAEILHHGPDRALSRRCDKKVDVIAHEDVRVDRAASPLRRFAQAFKIKAPIRVVEEARGAIVAALAYVQRHAGQFEARRPGHASITRGEEKGFAAEFVTGKFL
jgi:hypothetical protein